MTNVETRPQPDFSKGDWIPDVKIKKIEGNCDYLKVWFDWKGKEQMSKMEWDNHDYNDNYWLITDCDYTDDFTEWLDENLGDYDSLESMFESLFEHKHFEISYTD